MKFFKKSFTRIASWFSKIAVNNLDHLSFPNGIQSAPDVANQFQIFTGRRHRSGLNVSFIVMARLS